MEYVVLLKRYGLLKIAWFETLAEAEEYCKHDFDLYEIREVKNEQ